MPCMRGADLHMAQLMPLQLTVSCFSKIQIGFTFLVPVRPGSPEQKAVKRVCVCVCVCVCVLHANQRARKALPPTTASSRRPIDSCYQRAKRVCNSHTCYYLVFHHPLTFIPGLKPPFSVHPSYRSLSFSSSGLTTWIPQTVYC